MIVIKYPPDFDGELYIDVEPQQKGPIAAYRYTFTRSVKEGVTEWEGLVDTAKEILEQHARKH